MLTVHGYKVKNLDEVEIVSSSDAKKLRREGLIKDKSSRGRYYQPFVNPDSYTDEETAFLGDEVVSEIKEKWGTAE